jgi:hypothetical protein
MNSKIFIQISSCILFTETNTDPHNEMWATVSCESDRIGKAVCANLSPFDAMIAASPKSDSAGHYRAIPCTSFDLSELIADHDNQLAVSFQVAWTAHRNEILLRPSGSLAACAITKRADIDESENIIHFPISDLANT